MIRPLLLSLLVLSIGVLGDDWKPLWDGKTMKGWTKAPFGGSGDVEIENGILTLHQGLLTGVNCTNPIPKVDYEVEIEARRVSGNDFFCGLTFPVKDSFATLIVGGWGGSVVGISSLDDNDAAHNETTLHKRFDAGKWYPIRLQVVAESLEATRVRTRGAWALWSVPTKGYLEAIDTGPAIAATNKTLGVATTDFMTTGAGADGLYPLIA